MKTDDMKKVMGNYPLIKLFNYDEEHILVYDARPHIMFLLEKKDQEAFYAFLDNRMSEIADEGLLQMLRGLRSRGVLLEGGVERLFSAEKEDVKNQIEYYWKNILMRKFVIEITERCNFRCKYCPNSIETVYRHHTTKQMLQETAHKSIDFYKQLYVDFYKRLSEDKQELLLLNFPPTLGIYGGEPTLNWSGVVDAVDYFKSLDWESDGISTEKLIVTINTNLSLINEEILAFLVKHDILLFSSLDGPLEENDKNRVDIKGHGTFNLAYSNLLKIKEYNYAYFKNRVTIMAVRAENYDEDKVDAFLKGLGCNISHLAESVYGCFVRNPEKNIAEMDEIEQRWLTNKVNTILQLEKDNIEDCFAEMEGLYALDGVLTDTPTQKKEPNIFLSCPMGIDNIMIGANGDLHICHKTDGSMAFGNIHTGVDMDKMIEIYSKYINRTNCEECCSCWAVHFCKNCAATRMRGGDFANPTHAECDYFRKDAEWTVKLFLEIYKQAPHLIDELMRRKHQLEYYNSIVDFNEFIKR